MPAPITLQSGHPLCKARWIWPEAAMYLHNHYAHFRKDFELPLVPEKAPFYITADKNYRLYVNGVYVCRGPARGYQATWPFDEIDLARYLQPGRNWLAVEGYTPGISTSSYLHCTGAGMLCAGEWGETTVYSDRSWLMRRSPAHRTQTARLSLQTDFQEHVDLRLLDRGWITNPEPPTGWRAEFFPDGSHQVLSWPFGQPPYESVEPRGIPMLREDVHCPVQVTCTGHGRNGPDVQARENVSWGWIEDARASAAWDSKPTVEGQRQNDSFAITVPASGEDAWQSVTIDLGAILVGSLVVEVENADGGEILDFQHDQCLRDGKPTFIDPGKACLIAMANRLWCRPGSFRHEFFHLIGHRHLTVIVRNSHKPLSLRLQVRTAGYPFTMQGGFACSDDVLNQIHAACRHTQQICSLDAYVDTPWREQAQWWGDARVQAKNTFFLDGDARLLARGVRQIAAQRAPQNLTYGHAPTSMWWAVLPDFSLTWISTVCDHWYQTADASLLAEQLERIRSVLDYFESPEARSHHGLLRYDTRFWLFCDWAELYKGEVPTFLNLLYLYTLQHLQKSLNEAGLSLPRTDLPALIQAQESRILAHLYDDKAKLMHAGLDEAGSPVGPPSIHDQTLALMTGLAPEAHQLMLDQKIVPFLRGERVEGPQPSSFWVTYVLEEAGARGYAREAIDFIRQRWAPMLSTGTIWEHFHWQETGGSSCSHAWSAHPCYHVVNILCGVRQTAPGWREVEIRPAFVEGIDAASATVPTPLGLLRVDWKRDGGENVALKVDVPAAMRAKFDASGIQQTLSGPGEFTIPLEKQNAVAR